MISGSSSYVEHILQTHIGIDVNAKDLDGECTALHLAVVMGREDIVSILVEAGADVNAEDYISMSYDTPLTCAISTGSSRMVKHLIEAGAEISTDTFRSNLAMNKAVLSGRQDILQILLNTGTGQNLHSTLVTAACLANVDVIHLLMDAGADINEAMPTLEKLKSDGLELQPDNEALIFQ